MDEIVQKALYETGIPRTLWDSEAAHLSGGEKTKLSLCKILAGSLRAKAKKHTSVMKAKQRQLESAG